MSLKLYRHSGHSLLPLLRVHLPYSLSIYGTLLGTPPQPLPARSAALGHSDSVGNVATQAVGADALGSHIWTTFPPSAIPSPSPSYHLRPEERVDRELDPANEDIWTAIIAYPHPDRQIRIYNSLEHPHHPSRSPSHTLPALLDVARAQVVQAIEAYIQQVDPGMTYIGKVYKLWLDAVERYVADRARRYAKYESGGESSSSTGRKGDDSAKAEADVASDPLSRPVNLTEADALLTARWKKQGRYWVWCPFWEMNEGGQPLLRADIMKADVSVQGYEVDIGRQDDVADFEGPGPSNRVPGYYSARIPYSTVIRPILPQTSALSNISTSFDELWTSAPLKSSANPSTSASRTTDAPKPASPRAGMQHAPPAARILTHPDGGIGALSTAPAHRRQGLARWVVDAHLASGRGRIPDPAVNNGSGGSEGGSAGEGHQGVEWTYAVVHENNEASSALWRSMGWTRVFKCASVYRTDEDVAASSARGTTWADQGLGVIGEGNSRSEICAAAS